VHVGDTIYVAGTLGVGEDFASPDDMGEQTKLAYANIADTLANFGAVRRTERHSVCHQSGAVGQLRVWERRSGTPMTPTRNAAISCAGFAPIPSRPDLG
jgi:enamine deaminase RidA (YjgF/YER057c/UK114 family)